MAVVGADVGEVRSEVGDQLSAIGDRDHLEAAAHPEQRDRVCTAGLHESDLGRVPLRIVADVVATGQDDPVDHVQHRRPVPDRQDHRTAAGGRERVDVRRRHAADGELAPEALDDVRRAGDPDHRPATWWAHTATTAVTASAMPVR